MNLRISVLAAAMFTIAATAASGQTTTTVRTRNFIFGSVGLGSTETMQVNLLNAAAASSAGTAASCTGSVTFTSSTGTVIGTATTFTAASGQIVSISLPFARSGATGSRAVIVASVQSTSSSAPCALSTSLETFDTSSGATHVHLGGNDSGPGGFGH